MFLFCFSATVHISVVDINEYAPTFIEPSYVKQVDEGRLYNEIVRVEASDRDCAPKFGDVCKYEILTSDQPFTIDKEGKCAFFSSFVSIDNVLLERKSFAQLIRVWIEFSDCLP